jgi:hypothetical protein
MTAVPCWGKSPGRGFCRNDATRFFKSLLRKRLGMSPANRAVCDSCVTVYRFDHLVKTGVVQEVAKKKWIPTP